VTDLYNENYKTLRKKLKKMLEDRTTSHVYGLVDEYCETVYTTKSNKRVNVILIKASTSYTFS
jgi:hypothetical protein